MTGLKLRAQDRVAVARQGKGRRVEVFRGVRVEERPPEESAVRAPKLQQQLRVLTVVERLPENHDAAVRADGGHDRTGAVVAIGRRPDRGPPDLLTRLSRIPVRFEVSDGRRGVPGDDEIPRTVEADGHGVEIVPGLDGLPDDRAGRARVLRQVKRRTPRLEGEIHVSGRIQRRGRLRLNRADHERSPQERAGRAGVFQERDAVAVLVRCLHDQIAGRIHEDRHGRVVQVIVGAVRGACGPQGLARQTVVLHRPHIGRVCVARGRVGRDEEAAEGVDRDLRRVVNRVDRRAGEQVSRVVVPQRDDADVVRDDGQRRAIRQLAGGKSPLAADS